MNSMDAMTGLPKSKRYQMDRAFYEACGMVREAGYNACIMYSEGRFGEDYSRAVCLLEQAQSLLRTLARVIGYEEGAEIYIRSTYNLEQLKQKEATA